MKVLSRQNYKDDWADLAPIDIAFGWGIMANKDTLDKLRIWQQGRFYMFQAKSRDVNLGPIMKSSSNMHLIPQNKEIEKILKSTKPDQILYLEGYLVEAVNPSPYPLISSLSREDTGPGACEIIYVTKVTLRKSS